ncbi:helix-turn-helix domain-containing protein [Citrobacter farmeri]|uniref:helix-turn-helix domain-containing protein n=1 Tax=Citrobacter farmeri TaxID=67824 RepID=UPI0018A8E4BE|nr:helix-turn-helix domain-containing protein [Citrobacter farmeri]MDB2179540.1 helix-turn-helix domain-containing protein [Citrobacter farmeri]
MTENGWNKSDLAKKVMLSHTAVQNWAKGRNVASGERLKRLSAVTGRPEHWFFMATEDSDQDTAQLAPKVLDDKEEALLSLFNQLPEAEKLKLIMHTKSVLHDLEHLKSDVYDIISNIKK